MRKIRLIGATMVAAGTVTLSGFGAFAGAAAPTITHEVRLDSQSGARQSATSATWASSNWSGYAETGTFTEITGSWTVPPVTPGAAGSVGRHGSSNSAW